MVSAEYLFAMKAAARLETDGADLRLLARELGTTTAQALNLVERFYGANRPTPKTQLILDAVISNAPPPPEPKPGSDP